MRARAGRAHANGVENLPLFATIVLVAAVSGYSSSSFDALARTVVLARIPQSLVHIASGSELAVNVRFLCFLVQVASMIAMLSMLLLS